MSTFIPGLRLPQAKKHALLSSPQGYRPPARIDRRLELLTASNQGASSKCAGYGMAGWLEFHRWRDEGNTEQIDPNPIYARAKEIDGAPSEDGTTLQAVVQAAQDLGLMSAVAQESIREISTPEEVKQALHRYGVVLAAFNATEYWSTPGSDGWMREGGRVLGGHCVIICGFADDDVPNYFSLQQSWGADLGWRGFVRMNPSQFRAEFQYGLIWDWANMERE